MGSSPAYPSDLTDAQWALIEPLVPVRSTRGRGTRGGRPPKYPRRRVVDAIVYLARTGCSRLVRDQSSSPCRPSRSSTAWCG